MISLIESGHLRLDTFVSLVRVTSIEGSGSWKEGKVVLEGVPWSLAMKKHESVEYGAKITASKE